MEVNREKGTLIIGGGMIGLAIGWKLLEAGEPVTLLEQRETGRESSWAAAGMLAPVGEVHFQEEAHLQLGRESMALYPAFIKALESYTGHDVGYRTEGSLGIALDADETAELRHLFEFQRELKLPVTWLSGDEVQRMEPALSHNVVAGVFSEADHSVDNRKLAGALKAAFIKAGGSLHEHTPAGEVVLQDDGPPVVRSGVQKGGHSSDGEKTEPVPTEWHRERVILCAGAWSGLIPGLEGALRPLVRPVKGQMLAIGIPTDMVNYTLRTPDVYMVPRKDGRLLVGATVEEMGFNREQTVGGLYELLRGAWRALPGVYERPVLETWVGFRPGSRDNAPLLGETDVPGLYLATGHYRNGILNTPVTAAFISDLILGKTVPEFLSTFSPRRFISGKEGG